MKKTLGIWLAILGLFFYGQFVVYDAFFSPHKNDFAHLYIAGYLAAHGQNTFDPVLALKVKTALNIPTGLNPFVYPPFFGMILIPLSWVSYDTAWAIFFGLSQSAYWIAITFLIRLLREEEEPAVFWWGIFLLFSACFYPLTHNFASGQMNTFLLFVICASGYKFQRRRDVAAGALIGLGAAIKIAPGLFILYFLWKKRWIAAAAAAGVIGLSVAASLLWWGWEVHDSFLQEVKNMGYGSSTWAQFNQHYHVEPNNQAPSALWYRLLTHNPSTTGIIDSPQFAKGISYLTAILVLVFLARSTPQTSASDVLWEYAVWSIAMLLLPSLMWSHYLVQAMLAIALAMKQALTTPQKGKPVLTLGLIILAVPLPYYLDFPPFKTGWWTLVMSVKLYGLLMVLWFLWVNHGEGGAEKSTD